MKLSRIIKVIKDDFEEYDLVFYSLFFMVLLVLECAILVWAIRGYIIGDCRTWFCTFSFWMLCAQILGAIGNYIYSVIKRASLRYQ